MKAEHTPGQWENIDLIVLSKKGNWKIAEISSHCYEHKKYNTNEEVKANAQLIAAAPELLNSLKSLAKASLEADILGLPELQTAVGKANKAIAAAEGEK